jgi:hypothetical protein
MSFVRGELVGVPCSIQSGAFPHERVVMVETDDGAICGFVKQSDLEMSDEASGYLKSAVVQISRDSVVVRMFGSFFTTALGFASVRPDGLRRLAAP